MSVKIILSFAASIIKVFIILVIFIHNSKADENNIKHYSNDLGILALMYHRFNENKYPSTNIKMNVFKKQINIINNLGFNFFDPGNLEKNFSSPKIEKKILITIDDAFLSFYETAWPFLN